MPETVIACILYSSHSFSHSQSSFPSLCAHARLQRLSKSRTHSCVDLSTLCQPLLHSLPLPLLHLPNLIPRTIKPSVDLIEGILPTLLKLLPTHLHPLIFPQALVLLLDLRQSPRFKGRIRCLVSPLGMPIYFLGGIVGGEGEGIEGIVYACGVEGRFRF